MKYKQFYSTFALAMVILFVGCKKEDNPSTGWTPPAPIPVQATVQTMVQLNGADNFVILAGTAVTNSGITIATGDLGLSPGTSVSGFPPGILNGELHVNDAEANQAKLDLNAAFNDAAARVAGDMVTLSGNIGGLTLTPGLYKSTSSLSISAGNVTLDGLGDANAVFIIQVAASLTTAVDRKVILTGGAQASNIFWVVSNSTSVGAGGEFKGTILALESITFGTGAKLEGRALARNGEVTMDANSLVID